jgi:hypothetical protein
VLTNSGWANASQLQTVKVGSTIKICAVSSAGTTILRADWDGTQIVSDSLGSVSASSTILSLAGINWDTGGLQFAYDDGSGLHVVSSTGTPIYSYGNTCTAPMLLRTPFSGTTDNVIWVTHNPFGSGQILTVMHPDGTLEAPVYFGTMTAAHIALADMNADQLQDLVIAQTGAHYAWVLHRQTGSMSFGDGTNIQALDLTAVYGTCTTAPVFAAGDLDGDGDEDLLFAGQVGCANQALVWPASGVEEEYLNLDDHKHHVKPWLSSASFTQLDDSDPAELTLDPWDAPTNAPANAATDLHVTVWARMSGDGPVEPLAVIDSFFPLETLSSCTLDFPLNYDEPPQYLVVCLNFVQRSATTGAVLHSYPSWVGQIDPLHPPQTAPSAGSEGTGGIDRPPPPPSPPPTP